MNSDFVPFIQAIGRGQNSGRYLSQDEAYFAMKMVLNNEVSELQKGAFLMLLRVREESTDELIGFVKACRDTMPKEKSLENSQTLTTTASKIPTDKLIDWGCYAGKRRQLPWFLSAISILVEQGYKVLIHGAQEPASKRLYVETALKRLGLYETLGAYSQADAISKTINSGLAYINLENLHPNLHALIQLRSSLGLRSCANTLARLLNPSNAAYSIQGVHHRDVDVKHQQISHALGDTNSMCFRGEGGEPEVSPSKITDLRINRGALLETYSLNAQQTWEIKPKELDLHTLLETHQDEQMHSYGENTVLSTLTAALILIEKLSVKEASQKALVHWKQRDKDFFLGVPIQQVIENYRIGNTLA
ncbi:MAG: anthranilate phosphoribosyltransferase [Alphaproteobacteria bacterium]|jgi:anthranilate phosphoribosyltransferase